MSPELFNPEIRYHFRTKYSDCYALGMVIYEVLSERIPFHQYATLVIPGKVVKGDRPKRPQGVEGIWFTNDVWEALGRCWTPQPGNRPNIEDVLQCLEQVSGPRSNISASVFAIYKRLEKLDPSDDNYRPLLRELLNHRGLKLHVRALRGSGLEEFIEVLDKVSKVNINIHQC